MRNKHKEMRAYMQYETIILEMMSRVQKLEEEVEQLKNTLLSNSFEQSETQPKRNVKVTPEMTRLCYEKAKEVYKNKYIYIDEFAEQVSNQTGMNFNTAKMNIYSIAQMLRGEEYNRLLSADSLDLCLDMIYRDYGEKGLRKALKATELHIEYLKTKDMATSKLISVFNKHKGITK